MNKRFILVASLLVALGGVAVLLLQWYNHANSAGPVTQKDLIEAQRRLHIAQPVVQSVVVPMPTSPLFKMIIRLLKLV